MSRPDRLKRVGLLLIGVALAATGGYGLARGFSAFGAAPARDPVFAPGVRAYSAPHPDWLWWAAATASVIIVGLVALGWLRVQFRMPRPPNHDLVRSGAGGTTRLCGGAAAAAVAADIAALPRVVSANARVWGDPDNPHLYARIEVEDATSIPALGQQVDNQALTRLRRALQADTIDSQLELSLTPSRRSVH